MDWDKPLMLRLISRCITIAERAGAEVRRVMESGRLGLVDKGMQDFQTEADRVAQRLIVASLTKHFPKCTIVGEEELDEEVSKEPNMIVDCLDDQSLRQELPKQYKDLKEEQVTIWVDPLDGTTEFVKGLLDHVTVLIGISVDGASVAGVIHQPYCNFSNGMVSARGRTIWGLVGLGCYGITQRPLPEDKFILTTTASHGSKNIDDCIHALKPDELLRVGGAGHKVLLVIEAKAHAYVFASGGCKRWDTCAPEAVLVSAGGRLTTAFGDQIEYHYKPDRDYTNHLGVVASFDPTVHKRIITGIPESVKWRLRSPK